MSLEDILPPAIPTCFQDALEKAEGAAALRRCLARLSSEHRAIVFLIAGLGDTFVEASGILGVQRTTLVSRNKMAVQRLDADLGPTMIWAWRNTSGWSCSPPGVSVVRESARSLRCCFEPDGDLVDNVLSRIKLT